MKTYSPKPEDISRRWYVVDAQGAVLGRLATQVATILRGKHKPMFAPHMDTGDHVIVVNAGKVVLTGGKEGKKIAYHHSGYPGGMTATGYDKLMREKPEFVVEKAVRGMLPKNRLGRSMLSKLSVYAGEEHRHAAQQPEPLALGTFPTWTGLPEKVVAEPAPAEKPKTRPAAKKADDADDDDAKAAPAKKPAAEKKPAAKPAAKKPAAEKPAAKKTTTTKAEPKASTEKAAKAEEES